MSRLERKFGEVRQASNFVATQIVAPSNKTRNILVNLNARSGTGHVNLLTGTGPINHVYTNGFSIAQGATAIIDALPISVAVGAISVNGQKRIASDTSGNVYLSTISTGDPLQFLTDVNLGDYTAQIVFVDTMANATADNISYFTNPWVWLDNTYVLGAYYRTPNNLAAPHYMWAVIRTTDGVQTIPAEDMVYVAKPTETAGNSVAKIWGVYRLHSEAEDDGFGYILGGLSTLATTGQTSYGSLGIRVLSAGTYGGQFWWDGAVGRTSGDALAFFMASSYNKTTGQFAFSHSVNNSNPWLGAAASGGADGFTDPMPYLPTTVAPAGFRIVNDDGINGFNRSMFDGTTTYPDIPSGVRVPTNAELLTGGYYSPIAAISFSPSGEYLAVAYQRNWSAVSATIASRASYINSAKISQRSSMVLTTNMSKRSATPGKITIKTEEPHEIVDGEQVNVVFLNGTDQFVDGSYTASVIDEYTFSYPFAHDIGEPEVDAIGTITTSRSKRVRVYTISAHGYGTGEEISISYINQNLTFNNGVYEISVINSTSFEYQIDSNGVYSASFAEGSTTQVYSNYTTITTSSAHGFNSNESIDITYNSPNSTYVNGKYKITVVNTTTFKYENKIAGGAALQVATGTAIANDAKSVVVVYENESWAEGTTAQSQPWEYKYCSGSQVPFPPNCTSAMAWSSDETAIAIGNNGKTYVWTPGFDDEYRNLAGTTTITPIGEYPNVPSFTSSGSSGQFLMNPNTVTLNATAVSSNPIRSVRFIDRGDTLSPAVITQFRNTANTAHNTINSLWYSGFDYTVDVSATETYVNTVAQSIPVTAGTITQISNIVLEPGEGLYLEPEEDGVIEAVAYGVEIS